MKGSSAPISTKDKHSIEGKVVNNELNNKYKVGGSCSASNKKNIAIETIYQLELISYSR